MPADLTLRQRWIGARLKPDVPTEVDRAPSSVTASYLPGGYGVTTIKKILCAVDLTKARRPAFAVQPGRYASFE
jgi:hypothetical protein